MLANLLVIWKAATCFLLAIVSSLPPVAGCSLGDFAPVWTVLILVFPRVSQHALVLEIT